MALSLFGKFKNEDYIIETEIPNLTWAKGQEVKKGPLSMEPAAKKGQAKAKAKAKAKASAKAAAAEEDKASSDLEPMDAEKENSAAVYTCLLRCLCSWTDMIHARPLCNQERGSQP